MAKSAEQFGVLLGADKAGSIMRSAVSAFISLVRGHAIGEAQIYLCLLHLYN